MKRPRSESTTLVVRETYECDLGCCRGYKTHLSSHIPLYLSASQNLKEQESHQRSLCLFLLNRMHISTISSCLALALLSISQTATAKCCLTSCIYSIPVNPDKPNGRTICVRYGCEDGSNHSWTSCCGLRKCNIFCCNCDKTGDGKSRSPTFSINLQFSDILINP
jgi:hypothetical protein